jgi:hypothetical protein
VKINEVNFKGKCNNGEKEAFRLRIYCLSMKHSILKIILTDDFEYSIIFMG